MSFDGLCQFERIGEAGNGKWRYKCVTCEKSHVSRQLNPALIRRRCKVVSLLSPREKTEAALRMLHERAADSARSWASVCATLDRCYGGCEKMTTHCTLRGSACKQRQIWLQYILFHDCEYGAEGGEK